MGIMKKSALVIFLVLVGAVVGIIFVTPLDWLISRVKLPETFSVHTHGTVGHFHLSRIQYRNQPLLLECEARLLPIPLFALRLQYNIHCRKPMEIQGRFKVFANRHWQFKNMKIEGDIFPVTSLLDGQLVPLRGLQGQINAHIHSLRGYQNHIHEADAEIKLDHLSMQEQEWFSELALQAKGFSAQWSGDGAWVEASGEINWDLHQWQAESQLKAKQQPAPMWLGYFGKPDGNGVVHVHEQGQW